MTARWPLALVLGGLLAGCGAPPLRGSGVCKLEDREVGELRGVEVEGGLSAEVSIGPPGPVHISGDDNLVPLVRTTMRGGHLVLSPREGVHLEAVAPLRILVSAPHLAFLAARDGSELRVGGVSAESFAIRALDGSAVSVAGRSRSLTLDVADGSHVEAGGLAAETVEALVQDGSSAVVQARTAIAAEVRDGSSLTVLGEPKQRAVRAIDGSGVVFR